jgi:mRNA-degrading endonuclease RelE of RelBE toxin-antitoxin system
MNWTVRVMGPASRGLKKQPKNASQRIESALLDMRKDPFKGDVLPLKGIHRGSLRRRIGPYRILFDVDIAARTVDILNILRRSSTTY